MSRKIHTVFIMCIVGAAGCASSERLTYESPPTYSVEMQKSVTANINEFKDAYLEELNNFIIRNAIGRKKTFFTINNNEKNPYAIYLSFISETPGKYIDCGSSTGTFSYPSIKAKDSKIEYTVADSTSPYTTVIAGTYVPSEIERKTSLKGDASIYIIPGDDQFQLRVYTRYIWSAITNIAKKNATQSIKTDKFIFSGNLYIRQKAETERNETILCRSKGTLEKALLNLTSRTIHSSVRKTE